MAEPAKTDFICACGKRYRSACQYQPFFKRHAGKDYCVLHYPNTDKIESFRVALRKKLSEEDFDFRGIWFPEAINFMDTIFNADADFTGAKFNADADFTYACFNADADFKGAYFKEYADFTYACFNAEADFKGAYFNEYANLSDTSFGADACFIYTCFSASATFYRANFSADVTFYCAHFRADTKFTGASFGADADFTMANFTSEVAFYRTHFNANANFMGAWFGTDANFNHARFSASADFVGTSFSTLVNFRGASFKDFVRFGSTSQKMLGEEIYLDLQLVQIEKPERFSFHTLILRPSCFLNVDSRKFEFVDVDWNFRLKEEIASAILSIWTYHSPHRLLAITFRQLADNAEANHRYHEASRFRYNAFEARRIEKSQGFVLWLRDWWQWLASSFKPWQLDWWYWRARGFKPWRLDWWYWLASGYGESVSRAFLVFVALLALFTLGYKRSEFVPSAPTAAPPVTVVATPAPPTAPDLPPKRLGWREAALYSFNVSILQKPEPKPKGLWSSFLVALETVLGPAQAALLALAVRRRFMR